MKRKNILIILILALALTVSVAGYATSQTADTTAHDEFIAEAERKAQAALEAVGDDCTMDARTEVVSVPLENTEGDTIIYHACKTTYYGADLPSSEELNVQAIHSIIDPEEAESAHPCTVKGKPGALYDKGGWSYLCWTISSEYSLVIEYTPGTVSEAAIFEMAESVPVNEW